MSRLSMKDGRIVLDDQSEKPKSTTQKTSANDSRLSMVDGRIVLADRAPVNTAKNQSYLQRTQKAQQEYLAMDDYTPQRRSSNVMEMAINSLRNRLANSNIAKGMGEWTSRVSGNIQNVLNESPEHLARKQQAKIDRAALIDQISVAEEPRKEALQKQWEIDNAQLIDQASSQYEGPTITERGKRTVIDMSDADMFSNDWSPESQKEVEYERTVQNPRYEKLGSVQRDAILDKWENGNLTADEYQELLYLTEKYGGIDQLKKEQVQDMSRWDRFKGTVSGVFSSAGENLYSGYVLGNVAKGYNMRANQAMEEYDPALEATARRWFWGIVNGADNEETEEAVRQAAAYIGGDAYADKVVSRVRERANQAIVSDDDPASFEYNLLGGIEPMRETLWENLQGTIEDTGIYEDIMETNASAEKHLQQAKDLNNIQDLIGYEAASSIMEGAESAIENAADALIAGALGFAGSGLSYIPFIFRSFGGSYASEIQGATEGGRMLALDEEQKASLKSGFSAGIEYLTERMWSIGGALGKRVTGGGALDDLAQDALSKAITGFAKSETGAEILLWIGEKLLGGATEGLEEIAGNAAEQLLKLAGIMPGEPQDIATWWEDTKRAGAAGFWGGILGNATNIVAAPLQQSQIGKQLKNGGLDISLSELADLANSEGMENTSLAKAYSDVFSGMPRNIESISDLEAGKLYTAYEEMLGKRSDAINRIEQMQAKVEAGEELTRADVNRITNNSDAVAILAESGAVSEDAFSGGINERRDAVEMALRAFANGAESANQAQAENVQAATENASTPILQRQMDYNAMMAAAQGIRQNTAAEDIRNGIRAEQSLRDNVISSARSVYNAAERLGASDQAQDVMAQMYSPGQNTIDYAGKMTSIYNRAKAGDSLDVSNLDGITMQQAQAVHNVGRMEYLQEEAKNGEESGLRVRTGSERQNGQSAGGSVGVLEESTGAAQGRQIRPFQRESGNARVSAESLMTEGAKAIERSGLRIVTNDSSVATAKKYAEDRGVNFVAYAGGALNIDGVQSRGYYDSDTNTVYVRADHRLFTAEQIAKHETTHAQIHNGKITLGEVNRETVDFATVRDALVKELTQERFDEMVDAYVEMYAGTNLSRQDIFEELICDSVAGMNDFVSVGHLEEAVKFAPSMSKAKAVAEAQEANGTRAGPAETNEKTQRKTSAKLNATLKNVEASFDAKTESAAPTGDFSRDTWNESEYVIARNKAAKELATALGVTQKKAKEYIDNINGIAKAIGDDAARLDYKSSPGRSSFVSNAEYGGSFDFSTLCKKRRLMTGTMTAIQNALPNTVLTPVDFLKIRNMMLNAGLEASCGLCYVEGSRAGMGQFTKEFIRLYKKYYPNQWAPTQAEMSTPDSIEDIRLNHPEVYEEYENFWNNHGKLRDSDPNLFASQQKPKLYQLRTAYNGEVLKYFKKDSTIDTKNRNGGVRMQSFSDFEIVHLIDTMQIIMDMSRVGLAGQAYTKVPDFALALGNTGLKINLSLITKGVDANGKLIFDDREGMNHETAFKIRDQYSKNVGTILVTFTDEQLKAAMADDRVDFIIPFHRSQWKKSQYAAMGLPANTKDYTYQQNEKWLDQSKHKHEWRGKMVDTKVKNYMPNEWWQPNLSGKENAEYYLKMCARDGKRPKFYKFLDYYDGQYHLKKDGSTDGYWKLLIDFKMYDNDGNFSPQMPVRPDFNMGEANRMLDSYEGGHEHFPVAQGIVDDFVKEYQESHKSGKLSRDLDTQYMAAAESGDTETAQRLVDEAAKAAGYTVKAYHGTHNFGRTKFNADWPTYLTSKPGTARAFSGGVGPRSLSSKNSVDSMTTDELISAAESSTYMKNIKRATKEQIDDEYRRYNDYGKSKIDSARAKGEPIFRWSDDNYNDGIVTLSEIKADLNEVFNNVRKGGTYTFYVNPGDALTVYGDGAYYTSIPVDGMLAETLGKRTASTDEILKVAADLGFDSVIYKDIAEGGDYGRAGRSDVYAVVRPDINLKSADPITYDDAGNIIPLSERFNSKNDDIRYSRDIDSAYMAAVESKDMKTARKMVQDAAIDAGAFTDGGKKPVSFYHGTSKDFTVFDAEKMGDYGTYGIGHYFADNKKIADDYGYKGHIIKSYLISDKVATKESHNITADSVSRFLEEYDLPFGSTIGRYTDSVEDWLSRRSDADAVSDLVEWARKYETGKTKTDTMNDIINILGVDAQYRSTGGGYTGYLIVYNNKTIKSAEPIVRDNNGNIIPLSERFNTKNDDIRFSRDLSSAYMAAAESGDTETAAKLVKQAAEAAGYTVEGYHGTQQFGFTKIDRKKSDYNGPFFVTADINTARTYSTKDEVTNINRSVSVDEMEAEVEEKNKIAYDEAISFGSVLSGMAGIQGWADIGYIQESLNDIVEKYAQSGNEESFKEEMWTLFDNETWALFDAIHGHSSNGDDMYYRDDVDDYDEWIESDETKRLRDALDEIANAYTDWFYALNRYYDDEYAGNYHVYINPANLFVLDCKDRQWNSLEGDGKILKETNGGRYWNTRSVGEWAEEHGYDGVLFHDVVDDGGRGNVRVEKPADVYALFNPQAQVKSADPITYDDDGNVIPLEERFNPKNDDIRFSRELKSESVRAAGEKLTERQFYSLYSAHKLDMRNQGNIDEQLQKIRSEGFKGTGGFMGNVMPTNLSYNYRDGKPVPANVSVSRYAPRKGDRIMFVPRSGINPATDSVKLGYRPMFDYEIVTADYDYQPYYEMYSKAYDQAKESNAEIRYSRDLAPVFYSKLEREIEKYKGDKIGAASAISYLKGKGVKDEDIKWSGINTFLEGKKSVGKAELLEYLRDNRLQIQEKTLGAGETYRNIHGKEFDSKELEEYINSTRAYVEDKYGKNAFKVTHTPKYTTISVNYGDGFVEYDKISNTLTPRNNTKWNAYKTPGGKNYREVLYKIAGSEYSNQAMNVHWGEPGVVAHARIQDFVTDAGKILFVDEIQSDWHNAGAKNGYVESEKDYTSLMDEYDSLTDEQKNLRGWINDQYSKVDAITERISKKFRVNQDSVEDLLIGRRNLYDLAMSKATANAIMGALSNEEGKLFDSIKEAFNKIDKLIERRNEINRKTTGQNAIAQDAPFRNGTYIQYVLKDLLRKAAEGGYDFLAWTTGEMQENRWSSEYAEGYRIEYDQDIPSFLKKYGKQWGAKLSEVSINPGFSKDARDLYNLLHSYDPDITVEDFEESVGDMYEHLTDIADNVGMDIDSSDYERMSDLAYNLTEALDNGEISPNAIASSVRGETGNVHAIPITDAMRESVLYEGQPMFSRDLSNTELYEANRQLQKDLTELRSKLKTRTEQYKYWKGQTKVTEGRQLRIEDVTKLAREIIKGQESSADAKLIAEKMKALGEYLLNSQDENVYDEARLKAYEVAHDILANAKALNTKGGDDFYGDFRTALKNQTIYVAPSVREEVAPDGWNDFRKAQFGTVNMTADQSKGKSVDTVYHDLQATFGDWLLPEYITSEADQLKKILEVIETYRPVYENLNSYEMADAVEWTANEILTRIIGEEIRETNPTYADRMEKKLADQKAKAQTALTQVRQQRDRKVSDLKAHYQQVAEDRRNRKIDSEMRSRLLKIAKRLNNKKLDRVTRGLLDQYIGELDLVSKGILGRTVKELETLQAWYDSYKESMGDDFIPDKYIERKIARLSKKHISDLTQEEVADLTTVLLNLETMIRTQNQLIESQIKMDAYAAGVQTIDDINNSNGRTGFLNKYISTETATPEREIHRITGYRDSSPLYKAAKELSDGQRKMLDYQRRAEALFKKWTTDKKFIRRIAGKHAEEITVSGYVNGQLTDVKITPAMRMALYLHEKNDDNMRHISKGGVKIPDMALYKKGKLQEAYDKATRVVFTRGMLKEIASKMSADEKAFADAVDRYYNGMSRNEINDTSEALRGYAIAGVEHYYPIDTDGSFLKKEFDAIKRDGSIEGMGILKERIEGATNPIMLYDMNDTLNRSISQHSKYVGLAIPVRNFNKLYGVTTHNYETSVAETLKKNWGSAATSYIEKMMADVQNGTGLKSDAWGDLLARARSKYAGAVLNTNASVAMKQAASYPTAAAVVGYGPLMRALADVKKVDLDKLAQYTPLLWYRSKGFSTTELGDIGKEGGHIPKALNWIQAMDVATTTKLAKAAMYYVNENNNLTRGTDAWWKAVAEVYNRIIEETQPNYTMMQRPQILRSDNALTRALNMFKTQPFQNFNILYDAFGNLAAKSREYKANATEENLQALKSARTNVARAVSSQAVSAFIFALMQFAWDAFRGKTKKYKDDDDEMTLASWLKGMGINVLSSAGGMIPFGSYVLELGETMTDAILKAFKLDPFFDQTFYGMSENASSSVNDMGKAMINMVTKISQTLSGGEVTESTVRSVVDSMGDIAQFAGIPVNNVIKLAQSIGRNVYLTAEGRYVGGYHALRLTTDPARYSSDYYDLLWKAYNNDKAAYDEVLQLMLDDGFEEDKIKSAMEKRMKDAQGVSSVKDLESRWMAPSQQKTYDEGLADLDQATMFQAATDEQQQALLNKLYNLAVGNSDGKKLDEKIKGGASVGLDQTEYLLFQLALSMSDADGSGKANQEEAEAAALMVPGLSPEERAYLFQSVDSKWKNNPFK